MILTNEILEQGRSRNGAWSRKQLKIFGAWKKRKLAKGWKRQIIGKDFTPEQIETFLSLKDVHLILKDIFSD